MPREYTINNITSQLMSKPLVILGGGALLLLFLLWVYVDFRMSLLPQPPMKCVIERDVAAKMNKTFWYLSAPLILSSVPIRVNSDSKMMEYRGSACFDSFCSYSNDENDSKSNVTIIAGDVIAMPCSTHYFHFMFETVTMLESVHIHGILKDFPNATLLCFNDIPGAGNRETLEVLGLPLPSTIQLGEQNVFYEAQGNMIIPTFHNYHMHQDPYSSYNDWLIQSIKSRLPVRANPSRYLFISRRGYRRGIRQEDKLFQKLKEDALPNLENIFPDDYTVAEQAAIFSDAVFILSPHGAALTNLIFADWLQTTVIEITPQKKRPATFRNDVHVQKHYLITCHSEPGDQDIWDKHMDCDLDKLVAEVINILHNPNENVDIDSVRNIPRSVG